MLLIRVNDIPQASLHEFSILFVQQGEKFKPVLYKFGKRVVESYEIVIEHFELKDEHGRSA